MSRPVLLFYWFVCQIAHVIASISLAWAILTNKQKARNIVVAYDRATNAAFNGSDTETISSRAGRGVNEGNKGWCILCKFLDAIQKDHCKNSIGI